MLLKLRINSKIWKNKMNMCIIDINNIPSKKRFIEEIGAILFCCVRIEIDTSSIKNRIDNEFRKL